jgi:hypothetical protein
LSSPKLSDLLWDLPSLLLNECRELFCFPRGINGRDIRLYLVKRLELVELHFCSRSMPLRLAFFLNSHIIELVFNFVTHNEDFGGLYLDRGGKEKYIYDSLFFFFC